MPPPSSSKAGNISSPLGISTPKKTKQRKTSNESASSRKSQTNSSGAGHHIVPATPPFPLLKSLKHPSFTEGFAAVANLLKGKKNIIVLAGAGMSVSCGIPDFRSKGSGLYSTLNFQELGLSCPEELFDWEVFQEDPSPFFMFARHLYFPLGSDKRVEPSDSHKLLALLEQKKMLRRVYTQNIDGLEQIAGVSSKRMVYAHGSLQWASCCKCQSKVTASDMESSILKGTVPRCQEIVHRKKPSPRSSPLVIRESSQRRKRPRTDSAEVLLTTTTTTTTTAASDGSVAVEDAVARCGGVLKPGVTFFGETLHDNVRKTLEADRDKADALIVIGTSLSVAPMSKVIEFLPPDIPRILINRTVVHPPMSTTTSRESDDDDDDDNDGREKKDWRKNHVFDAYLLGFCDDVTRTLAKVLFSDSEKPKETDGTLLAAVTDEDEVYQRKDWESLGVPADRIFLFAGAVPSTTDDSAELTYQEIAHCDGCTKRIFGTVQKCVQCFDFDLCERCYPVVSKTHHKGQHTFSAEPAFVVHE